MTDESLSSQREGHVLLSKKCVIRPAHTFYFCNSVWNELLIQFPRAGPIVLSFCLSRRNEVQLVKALSLSLL